MNKGNQKATLTKYINYILEIVLTHKINRYKSINLKDIVLLEKYFPENKSNLNRAYSYMISQLLKMEIISAADYLVIPKVRCKQYSINVPKLLSVIEDNNISTDFDYLTILSIKPNDSEPFSDTNYAKFNPPINPSYISSPSLSHYNDNKVENVVWKMDVMDLNKVKITTNNFTRAELDNIKILMAQHIRYSNPIYMECVNICQEITEETGMPLNMFLNVKETAGEKYTTFSVSCRQYNELCYQDSAARDAILARENYDSEFDLHSAIFAVARMINCGEFNIDYDLKRYLFTGWDHYAPEVKEKLKQLLNRCFFNASAGQAWAQYHWTNSNKGTTDFIDSATFTEIYNEVQSYTGGTYTLRDNIFLYESLFELMVLRELLALGIDAKNVFDCFYYNSSQINEEVIKSVISKVAIRFIEYCSDN